MLLIIFLYSEEGLEYKDFRVPVGALAAYLSFIFGYAYVGSDIDILGTLSSPAN